MRPQLRSPMQPSTRSLPLLSVLLIASACSAENPQIAMCQSLARNLTDGKAASFEKAAQRDTVRMRSVKIDYSGDDGWKGDIDCRYPIDPNTTTVDSAPREVVLNGEKVPTRTLVSAGLQSSKELLSGAAREAADQTREYANEATDKARDLAGQAGDTLREGSKALKEAIDK